jgi:mRNA-degrading endonuclease YafQ of YafQ-DinJ toxin-antitoxin module
MRKKSKQIGRIWMSKWYMLTGQLAGSWAFSVDVDCRVVFMFLKGKSTVLLIDIGTHEEVY